MRVWVFIPAYSLDNVPKAVRKNPGFIREYFLSSLMGEHGLSYWQEKQKLAAERIEVLRKRLAKRRKEVRFGAWRDGLPEKY